MLENAFVHEGCENVYNESNYEKGTDTVFFFHMTNSKGQCHCIEHVLDTDIELACRSRVFGRNAY